MSTIQMTTLTVACSLFIIDTRGQRSCLAKYQYSIIATYIPVINYLFNCVHKLAFNRFVVLHGRLGIYNCHAPYRCTLVDFTYRSIIGNLYYISYEVANEDEHTSSYLGWLLLNLCPTCVHCCCIILYYM